MSANGMSESMINNDQELAAVLLKDILPVIYAKASTSTRLKNALRAADKKHKLYNIHIIKIINDDKETIDQLFRIDNLRTKSMEELKEIISDPSLLESIGNHKSKKKIFDLTHIDVGQVLSDDIGEFLFSLESSRRDLAMEYWGFDTKSHTQEILSNKYGEGVNKAEISRKLIKIEKELVQSLSIQSEVLREFLLEQSYSVFQKTFQLLLSIFDTEKDFLNFLETLCMCKKRGEIWDVLHPSISKDPKIIASYFAENLSPVEMETFATDIASVFGYEKNVAANAIKDWVNSGLLRAEGNSVSPIKLGKVEAAAHILLDHPNGLPWGDITNLVNKSGCSRTRFDENRMDQSYDSEYVYLCGRGTYKHQKYLTITEAETKLIINNLLEYFDRKDGAPIHLNDFYRHAGGEIKAINYNDLRHVVRSIGETYGIFFNGKSGADSVGLQPNFKRVDQQQVILNAMNSVVGAMTKNEIAERLRSKSLGHAGFYLDKMMAEDLVVKIDSMMYTTPEKAFKDIDCEKILKLIDETIKSAGKIVEVDFLRIKINDQLSLSYSKHWYAALASINLKSYGWFKNYNLFSCNEIPYVSLNGCCTFLCDPNEPNSVNLERLRKEILITEPVAAVVLNNWKIGRNNS